MSVSDETPLERVLATLQQVAGDHPSSSREYTAVRCAAWCVLFTHATGQAESLRSYIEASGQPLNEDEVAFLDAIGLSHDTDADDRGAAT
jgi:hypothetical protein